MNVFQLAASLARLPIFVVEQGLSAAAAALAAAERALDRRDASPEPVFVEPEPPFVEPEPVFVEPEPPFVEPEPPEPAHVSEESVLVAEFAEAGAEEGAGAELHVEEPWEGYRNMSAAQIRQRLRGADAATAAAVSLYEAANKGRSTVLRAASPTPSG